MSLNKKNYFFKLRCNDKNNLFRNEKGDEQMQVVQLVNKQ